MILVDTSVWIEHLRLRSSHLDSLLVSRDVLQHPFVTGELAVGNLHEREALLQEFADLPRAPMVDHDGVLRLLRAERLHGKGLGWIDVHLLASALAARSRLWTVDRSLRRAAIRLGIAA